MASYTLTERQERAFKFFKDRKSCYEIIFLLSVAESMIDITWNVISDIHEIDVEKGYY